MNYLKDFLTKVCGYLIDIIFTPSKSSFENSVFEKIPKALNDTPHIFSIFCYKNAIAKKIIKEIKYKGNIKTTAQASKILYEYLLEDMSEKLEISNFTHPIVVPIPATKHRMKEHGFNQCERIVKCIEKNDKEKYFEFSYNTLIKIKENESQAHTKSRIERLKNIKGSFLVNLPEKILNRNIILIDDVWTTGATIEEARKELIKAGAKSVVAYTIAH